ncbi:hypothetical protein JOF53_001388 [Crossiella equi]|uniref:Ricin B lectin domain-containing protein n=1 Tax=Crossiella equi TaxID=130796 RepID=A0ABS5A7E0_9PSEU|nr:RICIN domain-containing protein [Crossiella equi]MBP2472516.1 hypothetical protein [Crossiella equi]
MHTTLLTLTTALGLLAPELHNGPIHDGAGLCLHAAGTTPGDPVFTRPCDGSVNQWWKEKPDPAFPTLRSSLNGSCLDLQVESWGEHAVLRSCQAVPGMRFTLNPDGTIRSGENGFCLTVKRRQPFEMPFRAPCDGGALQRWQW